MPFPQNRPMDGAGSESTERSTLAFGRGSLTDLSLPKPWTFVNKTCDQGFF